MLASRPTCALARVSYMKSTRAKAPHGRELSGPVLPRDMDPSYPAIDTPSMPRSATVVEQAEQAKSKQDFKVEQPLDAKDDIADKSGVADVKAAVEFDSDARMREYLERKLESEQRLLHAQTSMKKEMKEWAERIPGQIGGVQDQLSVAGEEEIDGLTERLASLNSTLISVTKNYSEIVEGWDEFVAEKNANIAKLSARLDAMGGEDV